MTSRNFGTAVLAAQLITHLWEAQGAGGGGGGVVFERLRVCKSIGFQPRAVVSNPLPHFSKRRNLTREWSRGDRQNSCGASKLGEHERAHTEAGLKHPSLPTGQRCAFRRCRPETALISGKTRARAPPPTPQETPRACHCHGVRESWNTPLTKHSETPPAQQTKSPTWHR